MEKKTEKCLNCDHKIQLGEDIWVAEKSVLGPRGIIPLGKNMVFCSEECLSLYFSGNDSPKLPMRIPR